MTPVTRQPINDPIPWSYKAVIATVRPLLIAISRRSWSGAEHIPRSGGFIVASNHYSEVDPFMLAHFLVDQGRPPFFLAKSSLFTVPVLGAALRHLEQVPVYRATSRAHDALDAAREALAGGKPIAIMPEGTLTRDPDMWPMKARPGVGRLALTSRAPVVPVGQWGAQEVLGRYARRPGNVLRRPVQHIKAGPPVDLSDLYGRAEDPRAHAEATARVMRAVTELVADLRGETPPAVPYELRPGEMDTRETRRKKGAT
ncbi:lysophospholipid acyltransferase family protein [Ornithinimicrobium pekingense]|uniref:1-acyl-sn-glycerol-3-phosphate acyltransferase n=1 Tax=Ornithinimicrobium pekingense TaxID=384677 RepID=A0ABQ2F540_9MICO|nr:lysophospholipid acyltransferase family protein [Ornithinimicrobium pekingense]GGK62778.1 1-acyl-sn-glycerol-3-phosphate acyltransferase [Ornithinimicrobium pekingense]